MDIGPFISFVAGVASVLSPCVLPLLPIIIGYSLIKKETSHILSFTIGFFLLFTIIILLTSVFTAAINAYLYLFKLIAAVIIILIGIYFILNKNLFNFTFKPVQHRNNIIQSFLMGFLTSLAWSPCYGSYLIAVIAYGASSGDVFYSAINIILFTVGFSSTIFIIAILSSKLNINRLINYSRYIQIASGIIILIAGLYMLLLLIGGI